MAETPESLYFAYGSNMAEDVMQSKCPGSAKLGSGRVTGYRFAFSRRSVRTGTGVANIVADPQGVVWGVVWRVSAECVAALDRKEGYPWAYEKRKVDVELGDGTIASALTYVVAAPEPDEVPPSPAYIGGIVAAASENQFPADYIASLR